MIQSGVEIENIVINSYAASIATLSNDERELGVACVDMGGETCNLTIYSGNSIRYNKYLPVGSHHLTTDLSHMLNTPFPYAEEVKIKYGDLLLKAAQKRPLKVFKSLPPARMAMKAILCRSVKSKLS